MSKSENKIKEINTTTYYQFTKEQIIELKKSEEDIQYGRVISQEDLDKEDLEWLSEI